MPVTYEDFDALKRFVDFNAQDAAHLKSLAPLVEQHGPAITDRFYDTLGALEETARIIAGRVDALKKTHRQYLAELCSGDYGEDYFTRRSRIGQVHVVMGIDPRFVEGVMSTIRTGMLEAIAREITDPIELAAKTASFIKLCDLDLAIINIAYGEERLDRFSKFTGMSRRLIENVIKMPAK
jgi:hemoglobin-like flavoprotein